MSIIGMPIPSELQWLDFVISVLGAVLTVWAALSARSARQQAKLAEQAVLRVARTVQLTDLLEGMQELQLLVARSDFQLITAKSSQLHSRVVRFLAEGYNQLGPFEAEALAAARDQLLTIIDTASTGRGITKIRRAHANSFARLNEVLGRFRADPDRKD